jgi:peroxiredoxin Q/BCP
MSKKSRENSSKKPIKPAPRKATAAAPKTAARHAPAAAVKTVAKKAVKKAVKPVAKTAAKASGKTSKTVAAAKTVAPPIIAKPVTAKLAVKPKPAAKPVRNKPAAVAAAPKIAVEGALAPAFSLPRDGGASVSLSDYAGKKLVIFFYPRANTPGCTKEAIDFTRLSGDFSAAGAAVLGVSADPLKAQESFRDKHDLTMPLMSDETHAMLEAYGAWGEKSMYGKAFQGVFRTTVLIGKDGRVVQIWRNVKVDGHADAVLEAVRAI